MTRAGAVLLLIAVLAAVADWVSVGVGSRRGEYLFKPMTVVLLLAVAVVLRGGEPAARWTFTIAALSCSLLGDVFLMVPRDPFRAGLAAFLVAHLA